MILEISSASVISYFSIFIQPLSRRRYDANLSKIYNPFTTLRKPSLSKSSLKLINNPNLDLVSFK